MAETVITRALALDLLTQDVAAAPDPTVLVGAKMGVFINEPELTLDTVLADLTQPAFTGYALSAAITWGTPGFEEAGPRAVVLGDLKTFRATAAPDPGVTVRGWFVVDAAGTGLLAAAMLDVPVPILADEDLVAVYARIPMPVVVAA